LRNKAVEIANELLLNGAEEGVAIGHRSWKEPGEFFAKEKQAGKKNKKQWKKSSHKEIRTWNRLPASIIAAIV